MNLAIVEDIKNYSVKIFVADIFAGLTVAVILIPQGMAYAMLAGLPPIYGLYAALIPLFIYPLFSSSKELSIGPVALMSIIILAGVSAFAAPGSQQYLDLVLLTALLSGLIQVAFSVFRLGNLSKYISRPVMTGFIAAAGIIIAISQIKYLLSLELLRTTSILEMLNNTIKNLSQANLYSMAIGGVGILLIILLKKIHRAIPGALIVVIIGSAIQYFFQLQNSGVPMVGEMPGELPGFYFGFFDWNYLSTLFPTALVVSIVCFIGSYSLSKTFASYNDGYTILPNRELLALGLSKIVGSFFLAMPSTGSFTRSAINYESGAKTGLSSIYTALFVGLIIAFFSSFFYYLPEPILAAIVITSVFSLINIKEMITLFKVDRQDFIVLMITFLATLILGIVNGIIVGILFSLLMAVSRISKNNYEVLGRLPGTNIYRNRKRFPEAQSIPETIIMRLDQVFILGNAMSIFDAIIAEILRKKEVNNVILALPTYIVPDALATIKLKQFIDYCHSNHLRLILTDVKGPMRDHLEQHGIFPEIGANNFFLNIADAIAAIEQNEIEKNLSNTYAGQTSDSSKKEKRFNFFGKKIDK